MTRHLVRRAGGLALVALAAAGCGRGEPVAWSPPPPPSVKGRLHVSAFGPGGGAAGAPLRHETRWVRGPAYEGMEDNDLRGFLDGRFVYGWNQPGQIHNRAGRRDTRPRWGETELFRTLLRWTGVTLPEGARVREAEVTVFVEETPDRPVDVLLYAVHPDWEPGAGGERGDNTSPPRKGEVWWNEAAHGERAWGFPGVGFASQSHPEADTPVVALAEARLHPDGERIAFASPDLAAYAEEHAVRGEPLRFLLKLSDALEDTPDTLLHVWAANHGDARNAARRPSLRLAWEAPGAVARLARAVHLENGRELRLPRLTTPGARRFAVSFEAEAGHEAPTVEVRGGRGGEASPWRRAPQPFAADWEWIEVRLLAAQDPVVLGEPFETRLRDTWVRTAPPESQRVVFTFVSPRGVSHKVPAEYAGDYVWRVSFVPDELGRWRYRFSQQFLEDGFTSPEGVFDVVVRTRAQARRGLEALLARVRALDPPPSDDGVAPLAPAFWKLERAVHRIETPESLASPEGRELFALVTAVREALSGREPPERPEPIPMNREF